MLPRAARGAGAREGEAWSSCSRLSLQELPTSRVTAAVTQRAGRKSCRSCGTGCSRRRRSSTCAGSSRAGSTGRASAPARRSPSSKPTPGSRTRCARRAGSPRRPQLRNMGTVAGNLLQATRCWYWRLNFPCRLHGGDTLPRARRRAPRARDLRQRLLRVGAPVRRRGGAHRARRHAADDEPRARSRRPLPPSDRGRPQPDHARAGRADPRARRPATGRRART